MIVLCDIDNVLNNFTECCVNKYNKDNGTEFTIDDVYTYDIGRSLGVEDFDHFLNNYLLSPEVSNSCIPLENSITYLEKVNKLCQLYIVTARDWAQLSNIYIWFQKYYPFITDGQIIRCQEKGLIRGDVLIDDSLDNILSFPAGRILFDYKYNRNINDIEHFITRVHTWEECYNVLKLMKG